MGLVMLLGMLKALELMRTCFLLQVFFEGVQNRVATGVKPEEVGFQLAFSKQELRKVIKEYPVKEVRTIKNPV